ncbi:MAG: methyltransferase domain-containing protein [Chloroflexota bacterium]
MAAIHRARRQAVPVDGGTLIADTSAYDRLAGWLLGRFYAGVANDVAATVAPDARVLDVGCGPGHLLERLANLGLRVTGVDLDAAMVARAALRLGDEAEVVAG